MCYCVCAAAVFSWVNLFLVVIDHWCGCVYLICIGVPAFGCATVRFSFHNFQIYFCKEKGVISFVIPVCRCM